MSVLENMDVIFFKEQCKTDILGKKTKMESNEKSEIQTGMAVLENIDESFLKKEINKDLEDQVEISLEITLLETTDEPIYKIGAQIDNLDDKVMIEPKDEFELQDGLEVLQKLNKETLNQDQRNDSFSIKSEIEAEKKFENNAVVNVEQKESILKENKLKFRCNACESNFQYLSEFEAHAEILHVYSNKSAMKMDWMFHCNVCQNDFKYFRNLKIHVDKGHKNANPFARSAEKHSPQKEF